jgi:hypothetical protein
VNVLAAPAPPMVLTCRLLRAKAAAGRPASLPVTVRPDGDDASVSFDPHHPAFVKGTTVMHALRRQLLVPLFVAAALASGGAVAHAVIATPASHSVAHVADPVCPDSTNWNDILQACV